MSDNETTTVSSSGVHNNSTEFLIIVSQSVFFVLLFLMLKSGLVDRRGMMYDKRRIKEEGVQLAAIFFAIFVLIGIMMIPMESYEYSHFVVPITYIVMIAVIGWELYVVFNTDLKTIVSTKAPAEVVRPFWPEKGPPSSTPAVVVQRPFDL